MIDLDTLPNGERFAFWEDGTQYKKTYHVAQGHPSASDDNEGTAEAPLATIGRAAELLQPGEKVAVHEGVYRECVRPARGGTGPEAMIAYEAAPGESVVITAAESWTPQAVPSEGWGIPQRDSGATVWMADLPESFFNAYNPFLARNAYDCLYVYGERDDQEWMQRALLRRGMIFCDGAPLTQVCHPTHLARSDGAFWVEEPGLRIHFRLPGDAAPGAPLEVTAREQTFAPRLHGLGFVRVSGIVLRHAADGLPVPQRGSLSTGRGHHWIIEDCEIDWANGVGMSIGAESWNSTKSPGMGHHVVRRNLIRHCGVCGIAGARGVEHTLLEDNCFEFIGHQNLERMYECAGIKFHFSENCLIRGNVFRHIEHAGGIWLDVDNVNNRITHNVFADINTVVGAVYSEMNYERNMVDHNVLWDVRGPALRADCNEALVVAHNFLGQIPESAAIAFTLIQADRKSSGRTGLCRANTALNNVIYHAPLRVELGRREENVSDGNLFDAQDDACSFRIVHPAPDNYQKLATWQQFFGLDEHSTQAAMCADFDPDALHLSFTFEGPEPACQSSDLLGGGLTHRGPGPFAADAWAALREGKPVPVGNRRWARRQG